MSKLVANSDIPEHGIEEKYSDVSLFSSIMQGLKEAVAYEKGDMCCRISECDVDESVDNKGANKTIDY